MRKLFSGKALTVLLIAVVLAGYWFFIRSAEQVIAPTADDRFMRGDEEWARFQDTAVGLAFEYRQYPDGYVLLEPKDSDTALGAPVRTLHLISQADYESLQQAQGPREGPPGISIQVFNPGPNVTPEEWARANSNRSNIREDTEFHWVRIGSDSALRYGWDGLYQGESVIIARKGWVYVFSVAFLEQGMLTNDFEALLTSMTIQE